MKKIKFAISARPNALDTLYSLLVPTLIASGIEPIDIFYFVGGSEEEKHYINEDNVNIILTKQQSIDFTGIIGILEWNFKSDFWFLLHDTAYVGSKFFNFIQTFENFEKYDTIKLINGVSMNIGLYKQTHLDNMKEYIISNFKNVDNSYESLQKYKKLGIPNEDFILNGSNNRTYYENNALILKEGDFFNNGVIRRIEYFPNIDLYKVKANWYVKNEYEMGL